MAILANGQKPKCVKCGFEDIRALHLDHINGNGIQERLKYCKRNIKNGHLPAREMYIAYLKLPHNEIKAKLQILCANCNNIKMYENKEQYLSGIARKNNIDIDSTKDFNLDMFLIPHCP